jgi:uncharacterized protein (DUF58 family)
MGKRWILYSGSLIGCIVFYFAYREWFSWLALLAVLFLPVASLVLSLPAMTGLRLAQGGPRLVEAGTPLTLTFAAQCRLPGPPYRCDMKVTQATTGFDKLISEGKPLPTDHCGVLVCAPKKPVIYDYMGLFRLKVRGVEESRIFVYPKKVPVENLPSLERHRSLVWRPKPGGGFAENHEMRLYRPGDKLNQVHWKLSAKTGKLMIREAMEPVRDRICIEMVLRGTPEALDRDFGQLLWLSCYLLERDMPHELRVLTGSGTLILPVANELAREEAMRVLLGESPAAPEAKLEAVQAAWLYRIGGGTDG